VPISRCWRSRGEQRPLKHKASAGLLLFRRQNGIEVLLAHPGGPFWRDKDCGAWTVPKGEIGDGEGKLAAAQREFAEETGYRPKPHALSLGRLRQPGGKLVYVWAVEEDWEPSRLVSNQFSMEWPPRSGRIGSFPEIDRAAWFNLQEARKKILKGQAEFLSRLEDAISDNERTKGGPQS
jgi:predicted NUDIX family NTP pyrophosphohydrolase